MTYETKVVRYSDARLMRRGIKQMERRGWQVQDVVSASEGWSFFKTCCLGVLFFPLALLGRKPASYTVTFIQGDDSAG